MLDTIARELVTPKFIVLYVYFASVLFIHYRSAVRLRFGRQIIEHSGFFAPYNTIMYLFSKVSTKPILDVRDFPELAPIRENWETIRDEALALFEQDRIRPSERHDDLAFLAFYKRGWKRFHLKWYRDFLPSARELCPETVALVDAIPQIKSAAFTLLPPGAELGKHRDPFAGSLRYHLGLMTPNSDDCTIWIDGHPYSWRDGEDVVFDETYVHWAKNGTDTTRIIFFADVVRPLHTPVVRAFNTLVSNTLIRAMSSSNLESEKVGLLNRVSSYVYRYKMFLQRAKKRNRTLYYAVKYAFIAVLFYLIFLRGFGLV